MTINEKRVSHESLQKKRIMVIDDEEMVLKVTCIIIAKMGYCPISFSQSLQALDYYRTHFQEIDLVLLDMIMPELDGKDLFLSMKKINPDIKAILLSGWIHEEDDGKIHQWGLLDFLHKPIEKIILEESIIKALCP